MIAHSENFPTIDSGVSCATAPDRGDPLSPTTRREGRCAYTHIYCTYWHGYKRTHTHTHSLTAATHTLTHYTTTLTHQYSDGTEGCTSDNTDILEHINSCTPVYVNLLSTIHPYVKAMWNHFSVCIYSTCIKVYVCENVCACPQTHLVAPLELVVLAMQPQLGLQSFDT